MIAAGTASARAGLARRVDDALGAVPTGSVAALLLLDLDRFKYVNDALGQAIGDGLLDAVGARLAGVLGDAGSLTRLGGDEFAVLAGDVLGERGAVALAERLLAALAAPFAVGHRALFVTASVGIVLGLAEQASGDDLVRDADVAMYRAKEAGGGAYAVFDRAMRRRVLERTTLEHDLRRALDQREFVLFFQPMVSLTERRIVGVEALVRWQHPELGLVPPDAFIPVAEESGLILPLGRWVLEEACRHVARWSADPALDVPYLSVNVSGRQLADPALPEQVADVLRRSGVPAERLALELTESVLMENTASPTAVVQRLQERGVRLLLDDFGTGYSSLNYLKRFPIDALKVDRSFIAGITEDDADRHIFRAIAEMARGLGVELVAEGIETVEQARCVRALGCELAQGFLFAEPVPAAALESVLRGGLRFDGRSAAFGVVAQPPGQPDAAPVPEPSDAPTLTLGEAASALRISASTLRRWADAGRIRSVRTAGGHRRFPVAEVQRLHQRDDADRPALRGVALPREPLARLAALLAVSGAELVTTAARSLYETPRSGWFASEVAEMELAAWTRALAESAGSAGWDRALRATNDVLRQAELAGATLLERHMFLERFGDIALRAVQQRGAVHAELVGVRPLFARLREALLAASPVA